MGATRGSDYFGEDGMGGIEMVKAIKAAENRPKIVPKKYVGEFGITDSKGHETLLTWTVSDRRDRRHGHVGTKVPMSRHTKDMLQSMFKNW